MLNVYIINYLNERIYKIGFVIVKSRNFKSEMV